MSSLRPSVCPSISICNAVWCALWLSGSVYGAKSCTTVFLAGMLNVPICPFGYFCSSTVVYPQKAPHKLMKLAAGCSSCKYTSIDRDGFLIRRHTFKMAAMKSARRLLLHMQQYPEVSAGYPLAHRGRVYSSRYVRTCSARQCSSSHFTRWQWRGRTKVRQVKRPDWRASALLTGALTD